jgi:nucleoside 2-deoxyribosyltransferase
MKVTFVASHSQKEELMPYYQRIMKVFINRRFEVYSGGLFESHPDVIKSQEMRRKWYSESISHIKASDIVVIEISYPSTANVGHELTFALDLGKPVVCLYKEDRDPFFLMGLINDKLTIVSYSDRDLEEVLGSAIDYAQELQDTRFNFFISPQISNYLDWVAKKKKLPRAVYLRRLIEEDMKNNTDYEKS